RLTASSVGPKLTLVSGACFAARRQAGCREPVELAVEVLKCVSTVCHVLVAGASWLPRDRVAELRAVPLEQEDRRCGRDEHLLRPDDLADVSVSVVLRHPLPQRLPRG